MRIRSIVIAAALGLAGLSPATAQDQNRSWQDILAEEGLAAAEEKLAAGDVTAETGFLLGGVHFLGAVEYILQVRHASYQGTLPFLPGMRAELPANPEGRFDPAFLETAMRGALENLGAAERALEPAVEGGFAVEVPMQAVWFDINANGTRDETEGVLELMAGMGAQPGEDFDGTIRFDTADAEWLKAYVHAISAMAELVLATDPTPAIQTVSEGRAALEAAGPVRATGFVPNESTWIDTAAAVLLTLRGTPDAERTRAAHAHFKAMIAHNRAFWEEVAREGDNDHEWLPNASQTSAFGVEVSAETAAEWQSVLGEIEAILDGEALVPYWRVSPERESRSGDDEAQPVGLNIARLMQEPGDMDPILWIQGAAAAPYLEEGRLADMQAWQRFTRMTGGDSLLFAAWLN